MPKAFSPEKMLFKYVRLAVCHSRRDNTMLEKKCKNVSLFFKVEKFQLVGKVTSSPIVLN